MLTVTNKTPIERYFLWLTYGHSKTSVTASFSCWQRWANEADFFHASTAVKRKFRCRKRLLSEQANNILNCLKKNQGEVMGSYMSLYDRGCRYPECLCRVPAHAVSQHNRERYCKFGNTAQQESSDHELTSREGSREDQYDRTGGGREDH